MKMLRPEPSYFIDSLCLSRFSCRVGSSLGADTCAALAPGVRRAAGLAAESVELTGGTMVAASGELLLKKARPARIMASPASTIAPMTLLRFSVPIFNYTPVFKYVSSFNCSLTVPVCSAPKVTLSRMKNILSRSKAFTNLTNCR